MHNLIEVLSNDQFHVESRFYDSRVAPWVAIDLIGDDTRIKIRIGESHARQILTSLTTTLPGELSEPESVDVRDSVNADRLRSIYAPIVNGADGSTCVLSITDTRCPRCGVVVPAIAWNDTGEIKSEFCPTGCYDQYATDINRRTWVEILAEAVRELPDHLTMASA